MTKTISASQEHDTPGSPNPYDRHKASVSQTTKSAGAREGRHRPTRSKPLSIGYKQEISGLLPSPSKCLHRSKPKKKF